MEEILGLLCAEPKIRTALSGDMPTAVNAMTDSYLFSSA